MFNIIKTFIILFSAKKGLSIYKSTKYYYWNFSIDNLVDNHHFIINNYYGFEIYYEKSKISYFDNKNEKYQKI